MAVRYLVVHSSQLARQQTRTLTRRVSEEAEQLSQSLSKLEQRRFACQEDALGEAARWSKINSPDFHQIFLGDAVYHREISQGPAGTAEER